MKKGLSRILALTLAGGILLPVVPADATTYPRIENPQFDIWETRRETLAERRNKLQERRLFLQTKRDDPSTPPKIRWAVSQHLLTVNSQLKIVNGNLAIHLTHKPWRSKPNPCNWNKNSKHCNSVSPA
ncbi:hypothetical protein [Amaricoccus macauensis]|uniref:hypothetical protein n=1 Tax=Amaricoccus macauensis TaxID=57001 RepID=UPI003C7A9507